MIYARGRVALPPFYGIKRHVICIQFPFGAMLCDATHQGKCQAKKPEQKE